MMYKVLDTVVLDRNLPEHGLRSGDLGAVVQVYEPLGSAVLLTTELGGQMLKIQTSAKFRAEPGDQVWIRLGEEHQRWFDPQTALALRT